MRPIGPKPTTAEKEHLKNAFRKLENVMQTRGPGIPKTGVNGRNSPKEKQSLFQTVNKLLDLSLLKHRGFLLYLSGNVIMSFGIAAPLVFISSYAKSQHHSSERLPSFSPILAFVVDMVSRPCMGFVANTKWVRPTNSSTFGCFYYHERVCHMLVPLSSSYIGFCVYSGFLGFAFGWFWCRTV